MCMYIYDMKISILKYLTDFKVPMISNRISLPPRGFGAHNVNTLTFLLNVVLCPKHD